MTPQAALIELLGRVGARQGAAVLINDDELNQWPNAAVAAMKSQRLLAKARPATSAICPGCERECVMPVHVLPAEVNWSAQAFISCDKRDDISKVPVDFCRLEQWQTTGELIAAVLTKLLGLNQPSIQAANGKQWNIGVLKGKTNKSQVTLLAEDNLNLSLAGHTIPLIDVLTIQENVLVLDEGELIRLVDKPSGDSEDPGAKEIGGFNFGNDEVEKYAATNAMPSVPASEIRWKFSVIKTEDANEKWWKKMMRNASDTGLKECRVGGGRKGAVGSLWRPDLIAVWLVERTDKKLEGSMSKNAARAALKKFSGYEEVAEELFSSDE